MNRSVHRSGDARERTPRLLPVRGLGLTTVHRAFAEQVLPHEPALRQTALVLCGGNADEARDLVQDTLERALRSFESAGPCRNVRGWLFAIAHNLFIDRCRRASRAPTAALDTAPEPAAPEPEIGSDLPPIWSRITPEQLRGAVERLEEEFRTVFVLFEMEGRSYNDIVQQLGIPKATVGTRLARARRKIRQLLLREVEGRP